MERDLQVLGVRRWRELVADRKKWKDIVRQAKAHRGLWCQWKKKMKKKKKEEEKKWSYEINISPIKDVRRLFVTKHLFHWKLRRRQSGLYRNESYPRTPWKLVADLFDARGPHFVNHCSSPVSPHFPKAWRSTSTRRSEKNAWSLPYLELSALAEKPMELTKGKGEVLSIQAIKIYSRSKVMAPRILNLGNGWRWLVSCMPTFPGGNNPRNPSNKRFSRLQSQSK